MTQNELTQVLLCASLVLGIPALEKSLVKVFVMIPLLLKTFSL